MEQYTRVAHILEYVSKQQFDHLISCYFFGKRIRATVLSDKT
ncbi:hypothetical protein PSOS111911_05230 [Pseudoalteromonas ostreae]